MNMWGNKLVFAVGDCTAEGGTGVVILYVNGGSVIGSSKACMDILVSPNVVNIIFGGEEPD